MELTDEQMESFCRLQLVAGWSLTSDLRVPLVFDVLVGGGARDGEADDEDVPGHPQSGPYCILEGRDTDRLAPCELDEANRTGCDSY